MLLRRFPVNTSEINCYFLSFAHLLATVHRRHEMLEKTGWVRLVQFRHFMRLDKLLLAVFLRLLNDLVEARVLRHKLALEVEFKVDIDTIVLLDQLIQVKSVNKTLIFEIILHPAVLSRPALTSLR